MRRALCGEPGTVERYEGDTPPHTHTHTTPPQALRCASFSDADSPTKPAVFREAVLSTTKTERNGVLKVRRFHDVSRSWRSQEQEWGSVCARRGRAGGEGGVIQVGYANVHRVSHIRFPRATGLPSIQGHMTSEGSGKEGRSKSVRIGAWGGGGGALGPLRWALGRGHGTPFGHLPELTLRAPHVCFSWPCLQSLCRIFCG